MRTLWEESDIKPGVMAKGTNTVGPYIVGQAWKFDQPVLHIVNLTTGNILLPSTAKQIAETFTSWRLEPATLNG